MKCWTASPGNSRMRCMWRLTAPANPALERVCEKFQPVVRWGWSPVADKRQAQARGLAATTGEIVIFVDSDTRWTAENDGTLTELLKVFMNPQVGGVTPHQEIRNAEVNIYTRFFAWREAVQWMFLPPAQSVLGQVGVLPGRTMAVRREILAANLEEFLAAPVKISEDREQTMFAMQAGFRTVYQRTAVVETEAPTTFFKSWRQQYRWAKGSHYNTVRWFPMMLRKAPFTCYCFAADMVTPFLLVGVLGDSLWRGVRTFSEGSTFEFAGLGQLALLTLLTFAGWYLSAAARSLPHLLKDPRDWGRLPIYIVLAIVIVLPASILGLLTAGWVFGSGWGTRSNALPEQREITRLSLVFRFGPTLLALFLLLASVALAYLMGGRD